MRMRVVFVVAAIGAVGLVARGTFSAPSLPSSAEQELADFERTQAQAYCTKRNQMLLAPAGTAAADSHSGARIRACWYAKLAHSFHAENRQRSEQYQTEISQNPTSWEAEYFKGLGLQ